MEYTLSWKKKEGAYQLVWMMEQQGLVSAVLRRGTVGVLTVLGAQLGVGLVDVLCR